MPEAAALVKNGGEPLVAILKASMGKWKELVNIFPDIAGPAYLAERLHEALCARPDLALTGRDLAQGIAAPRVVVPLDVLLLSKAVSRDSRRTYLQLDLEAGTARVLYSFPEAKPGLPDDVELVAVRVEAIAAPPAAAAASAPAERPTPRPADGEPRPVYSEAALRAWYRLRCHTWNASQPPPSEDDDRAAAAAHFGIAMPRDPFRAIRRELAPEGWRKPGPRRPRA
jgi:hypothetical protein